MSVAIKVRMRVKLFGFGWPWMVGSLDRYLSKLCNPFLYDMKNFIFSSKRMLQTRWIAINPFLVSHLVPELQSFKEILHMTSCDIIAGYENGLNFKMSYSSAIIRHNRSKFCEQIVLIDMQLAM